MEPCLLPLLSPCPSSQCFWVQHGLNTPWLPAFAAECKRDMKKGSSVCCRVFGRGQENPEDLLMWCIWRSHRLNQAQKSAYEKKA